MKRIALLALLTAMFALPRFAHAQEEGLQPTELLVVVSAAAKIDTLSEVELRQVLFGKDARFDFIGLQEQFYRDFLKQVLKTNAGNFEREWLALLSRGKKKRRPTLSSNALELVAMVGKNKNALAIFEWRDRNKTPADYACKVVFRCRLKP